VIKVRRQVRSRILKFTKSPGITRFIAVALNVQHVRVFEQGPGQAWLAIDRPPCIFFARIKFLLAREDHSLVINPECAPGLLVRRPQSGIQYLVQFLEVGGLGAGGQPK
jgi:hypothetical protein